MEIGREGARRRTSSSNLPIIAIEVPPSAQPMSATVKGLASSAISMAASAAMIIGVAPSITSLAPAVDLE